MCLPFLLSAQKYYNLMSFKISTFNMYKNRDYVHTNLYAAYRTLAKLTFWAL